MRKDDKIKVIVAAVLFVAIGISYWLRGKDAVTKSIVVASAAVWLILRLLMHNKKKSNE